MTPDILEKTEKIVGYVLLAAGLVVVILPVYFGMSVLFSGSSAIPEIIEAPAVSFDDAKISVGNEMVLLPISETAVNEVAERLFLAVNLGLFFMISVILISAGSVMMGKGVGLIKEVKLKVMGEQTGEEVGVKGAKEVSE